MTLNEFEGLKVGTPVQIVNNKILSNGTKGKLVGFTTNLRKTILAQVHWLDGAPPICVKAESVKSLLPRKIWVIVASGTATSVSSAPNDIRNYFEPRRCFSKEEAEQRVARLQRNYPRIDFLICESTEVVISGKAYQM